VSASAAQDESNVVIQYRRSGLVSALIVFGVGVLFAVAPVIAPADTGAQIILAVLALFLLPLSGYSLYWMIRGLWANKPLVLGREGFAFTFQGEVFVPWREVIVCRRDVYGRVFVDLSEPIRHFAVAGWLRKHARSRSLGFWERSFLAVSSDELFELISSHVPEAATYVKPDSRGPTAV